VMKVLPSTGAVVGTYGVGVDPDAMVYDGTNIWVTNGTDGTVTKLTASTGATLGTYTVGPGPAGISFDGANIWVTNSGSNTVMKIAD